MRPSHLLCLLALALLSPALAAPPLPRALWVWDATTLTNTAKRQSLLDLCQLKGVTTLFLYTGGVFMTSADGADKVQVTRAQLGQFNIAAHALGLKVHALDGDPSYCLPEYHDRVLARLAQAIDFNDRQAADARLDGFHWDIEPHGLDLWKTNSSSHPALLHDFLTVARSLADSATHGSPPIPLGFAIPFWFDASSRALVFNGVNRAPAYHLFQILKDAPAPHIALMSYRDTVNGSDGTLAVSSAERSYARANTPSVLVWVGQETGPFDPPEITFNEEGPCALDIAVRQLSDALRTDTVVAGIAIHQLVYFRDMLDAQPALGDRRLDVTLASGRVHLGFTRASRDRCILETTADLAAGSWTTVATYSPADLEWTPAPGQAGFTVAETLRPDGLVNVAASLPASTDDAAARFFRVRAP